MNRTQETIRDNIIPAVLRLIHVLCMAYAAVRLLPPLPAAETGLWICLLFCALSGILHTVGVCAGQKRLSLAVICTAGLLLMLLLRSRAAAVSILLGGLLCGAFFWLERHDRPRQCFAAVITAGLLLCHFTGREIPLSLAAAVLLTVLTELADVPGRPDHARSLRLLPFLLLLEAAVLLLPAGDEPFDWSFLVRIGNRVSSLVQEVMADVEYRFSSHTISDRWNTGYGDAGLFGGRFSDENRLELTLSARGENRVLYLAGADYASLSGSRWEEGSPDGNPFISWYLTFLNALYHRQITPEEAACFAKTASTQITYQYIRTDDVLHPAELLSIDEFLQRDMRADDGSFTFTKSKKKGYHYSLGFLELDYANPYLTDVLRNAGTESGAADDIPSYEQLEAYSHQLFGIQLSSRISRENYEKQKDRIFHPDLTEWLSTDGTPDRVARLAARVADGYDNPFEQCQAVERYLRQYSYTKDVDYSGYVSFVDAFLFEKQAGYCIHFASAMVMMLRSLGIPARLVEGYCYDYGSFDGREYTVTGNYAHTWPEAYIDGFGWVRFEPTASVVSAPAYAWNLLVPEENAEDLQLSPASPSDAEISPQKETGALADIPAPAEPELSEKRSSPLGALLFFLAVLPAVYLLLLLAVQPALRRHRYRRLNEAERLKADLKDIQWLIRALFPSAWHNRPLLDYAEAIDDPALKSSMVQICLSYYRVLYRGGTADASVWPAVRLLKTSLYERYLNQEPDGRPRRKLNAYLHLNEIKPQVYSTR